MALPSWEVPTPQCNIGAVLPRPVLDDRGHGHPPGAGARNCCHDGSLGLWLAAGGCGTTL